MYKGITVSMKLALASRDSFCGEVTWVKGSELSELTRNDKVLRSCVGYVWFCAEKTPRLRGVVLCFAV